jgi:hypothetical protein
MTRSAQNTYNYNTNRITITNTIHIQIRADEPNFTDCYTVC